ncbi:MAG: heavy metal translocating P-type ATPase [Eubacterium sp.]|nr:heavy metal translocating P-type ATPase [Eubacterium sp.]
MTAKQKKTLIRVIIAFVLVAALMVTFHFYECSKWIQLPLYLVPYLIVGFDVLKKAAKNIRNGQVFDEQFLMSIATIGAIATGDFKEGVAVMLFYQIGELFQSIAVGKSRKNIADLMDIRPDTANLEHEDGSITEEDPDDIEIGSIIVVNPGEKVPIDGLVLEGTSSLDTSALTGESVPRTVHEGEEIISGCVSLSGRIKIKTTKEFGESTVSKILDLVENSSLKKARAENFISKFAKYYTPIVCYSALALALIPPVFLMIIGKEAAWVTWIMRALTFLVISCPCAVVISVPLSFFAGIGCASKNGILVKGSNYLEILSDTKTIVFDKTGTLTKGVFEVTGIYVSDSFMKTISNPSDKNIKSDAELKLLGYAAAAEAASSHPIAQSICKAYKEKAGSIESSDKKIEDITEIAGHGIQAVIKEGGAPVKVLAGNLRLMDRENVTVDEIHDEGTSCYIAIEGMYAGCIVISDVVKPNAGIAMESLANQGIKTVMLTGDSKMAAERVAEEVNVTAYKAELLPGDKVSEVELLLDELAGGVSSDKAEKARGRLAFVGDGINDAPVLARADIGIAMGAMGSDAAIEAADVVLMDDDPAKISLAMRISRKTLRIVRQNIIFAISVKVLCLILGALGFANMWIAIFADVGVMVIAVLNATRCLRIYGE